MSAEKKAPNAAQPHAPDNNIRKPWVPKSPVAIVLEQIGKQEKRVAAMQKELDTEKQLLGKLQKAKAALEA